MPLLVSAASTYTLPTPPPLPPSESATPAAAARSVGNAAACARVGFVTPAPERADTDPVSTQRAANVADG